MSCAVIFGGTGFIGAFFAKHLLESHEYSKIYLVDIDPLDNKKSEYRKSLLKNLDSIVFINGDVRREIKWVPAEKVTLIANFAAVHREPGHESWEYYETNLLGAENICSWAEKVDCSSIIFTSSISPYGPSEEEKTEKSIPTPETAYGGSKLSAEKIHQIWLNRDYNTRNLVITRPGVVFGPGEGGNVSRLIKAVIRNYFFYMGNRKTRKAGVYVKELCFALTWILHQQRINSENLIIFNMSMDPGPTIEDYVSTICKVAQVKRSPLSVPFSFLLSSAYIIDTILRPTKLNHPFSPVRIRKLTRSNNIIPAVLKDRNYPYKYDLESALLDWRNSCPEEWS